jgi:replicative superfamily II helicase
MIFVGRGATNRRPDMVDFRKHVAKKTSAKPVIPAEIYDSLDRESDKGPLRPAQLEILDNWHSNRRKETNVIVKLHTGQGKTLIGLLIAQSKLNEGVGPAVYLCPNNFLVDQTCLQAKQFGITVVKADADIPQAFIDSQATLVTSVQKLFNGLTKFGVGTKSIAVATVIMDDAHACIDAIRDACAIRLDAASNPYTQLRDLFEQELQSQGLGTFADIKRGNYDAVLLVPYWEWIDKCHEVAQILSKHQDSSDIKFAWPLLKNMLADCQCVISGESLEISPYLPPLHMFGSFDKAQHRVFMSATVTDDAFLVKGLGLPRHAIQNPLVYDKERWSGEKMILIPSLIDESLDRGTIVELLAKPKSERTSGVVALCPGFQWCGDWSGYGATVATKDDIDAHVSGLKNGKYQNTIVLVNRYDGIDLPDNSCRTLVFDSKPFANSVLERYLEGCLDATETIDGRIARTIEQGLGRSVRGEKDYCVIVLIGPDLVKFVRTQSSRKHFSEQTKTQIEIGLDIANYAKQETGSGTTAIQAFRGVLMQCLLRDQGWKEFYAERMKALPPPLKKPGQRLEVFNLELEAELLAQQNAYSGAIAKVQEIIDKHISDPLEKGWYLQTMARYSYRTSQSKSNELQVAAHKSNRYLLKPKEGMLVEQIALLSQHRVDNILQWIRQLGTAEALSVELEDILTHLRFGVKASRFEDALERLGRALGFASERPEKQWKEGPDNLWCIRDNEYLLFECKSEVALDRDQIEKYETQQMNASAAWFAKNYKGCKVKLRMIIPTKRVSKAAAFIGDTEITRQKSLDKLTSNVRAFFGEFKKYDLKDISPEKVQALVDSHGLGIQNLWSDYWEKPQNTT